MNFDGDRMAEEIRKIKETFKENGLPISYFSVCWDIKKPSEIKNKKILQRITKQIEEATISSTGGRLEEFALESIPCDEIWILNPQNVKDYIHIPTVAKPSHIQMAADEPTYSIFVNLKEKSYTLNDVDVEVEPKILVMMRRLGYRES